MSYNPIPLKWLNIMLNTIAQYLIPPTKCARFMYLCSTIIYYSLSSNKGDDMTEVELKKIQNASGSHNYIICTAFTHLYGQLGYSTAEFSECPLANPLSQPNQKKLNNIILFLDNRNNDGHLLANTPQPTLPNGSAFIDVENVQDLSGLDNTKWTPLKHSNNVTQTYLTPNWGNVIPPVADVLTTYMDIAAANYNADRSQEIQDMMNVYNNLNNTQRAIAEYFQGGKVAPPGIWNIWGLYTAEALNWNDTELSRFAYYLNTAMFMSSIACWKIKRQYFQSRPIQMIRSLSQTNVKTWDGTIPPDGSRIWKPFQQQNGRTPPFPDFTSGHSTFSSAAATIFDHFCPVAFDEIDFKPFALSHALMISPLLDNEHPNTVKKVMCDFGSSDVPQGDSPEPFPTTGVCLSFGSWQELAQLSGISRIYGGIHCQSANQAGLIIGTRVGYDVIKAKGA